MLNKAANRRKAEQGFLLIEVLVALLIFSFGLLALLGVQTFAITDAIHGKYRTDASYLANSIIGRMMVDQSNMANYATNAAMVSANKTAWDTEVSNALPNASTSISVAGTAVTVIVRWRNPDETQQHNYTALAQVAPSQAGP
jgi:type IV pilus assembly protein PilV